MAVAAPTNGPDGADGADETPSDAAMSAPSDDPVTSQSAIVRSADALLARLVASVASTQRAHVTLLPSSTYYLLLGTSATFIVLYYVREQHWLFHASENSERNYWSLIVALFMTALFFVTNAPLAWLAQAHYILAGQIVLAAIVLVRFAHKYSSSLRFSRFLSQGIGTDPDFVDHVSAVVAELDSPRAQYLIAEVERLVSALVRFRDFQLRVLFRSRVLELERSLIRLIATASPAELNVIVLRVNVARVLRVVQNHDTKTAWFAAAVALAALLFPFGLGPFALVSWGEVHAMVDVVVSLAAGLLAHYVFVCVDRGVNHNRAALMQLLAVRRASQLRGICKAAVIDALHKIGLNSHPFVQDWVVATIKAARGEELLELKSLLDSTGDSFNMVKLVFVSMDRADARDEILAHLATEAAALRKANGGEYVSTKVLSDVDDTLSCSGGNGISGVDARFPHGFVYPGVVSLYAQLDTCGRATAAAASHNPGRRASVASGGLAFLSARPHVYKGITENISLRKFRRMRRDGSLHTMPTLLPGTLANLKMIWGNWAPIIESKVENFAKFVALYPESRFVFVGDNGQGDAVVGDTMLRAASQVACVLIHRVQPLADTPTNGLAADDALARWNESGVMFFETFVGAAYAAYERRLLDAAALLVVREAAMKDWANACKSMSAEVVRNYSALLERDSRAVDMILAGYRADVPVPTTASAPTSP